MTRGQNSGSRARVCVTTIIAVVVLLAVAGPASALTWAGPTQLTDPVTQPALNAVTCISTSVCVAVGDDELEATFNPTSLAGAKATAQFQHAIGIGQQRNQRAHIINALPVLRHCMP